jgi:hypothetical protein
MWITQRAVFGAFLFLCFGISVASANTAPVSSDPSYASAFTFFCGPYVSSFTNGDHYMPTGSACSYSLPSSIAGGKTISLYQGTPGASATLLSGDTFSGSATLVQQSPNSFAGIQNETPFFAVVYDSSLDQGSAPLNAYLQGATSTLPAGAIPNQNYFILQWKWGPVPANEYEPVIIVPDTLNSFQKDSGYVVDPVFKTYQNLVDTLTANGYVQGQTLFTLPYNWEQSNTTLAQQLANTIASVKTTCSCNKVNVIAHGSGGLAVAQYITGNSYNHDIDQVDFIGTPFDGVPAAYGAWETGSVQFSDALRNGLAKVLITQEATNTNATSVFNYVQSKPVTSFLEMLPVSTSYLNGKIYPTGYPRNMFLENIQNNFDPTSVADRGIRVRQFDSDGTSLGTPKSFTITNSTQLPLWPDGQPTATQTTSGDGMVPFLSADFFQTDHVYSNVKHNDLPTKAAGDIFTALNGRAPATVVNNSYPVSCVLALTTTSGTDLQITDPNNLRLGKDFTNNTSLSEIPNSFYSGFTGSLEYGIIVNPVQGTYQVRTQGATNSTFTVTASSVCGSTVVATSTTASANAGQIIGLALSVSSSTQSISLTPLDTNPPIITISSPQQGQSYYQNDPLLLNVSVVDPEQSPIASTAYFFNGTPVNPANPLPLSSAPLGTSTVTVTASDIFGNTAYATSSFQVLPPNLTKPIIKITNPLANGLYARSDTVFLTATITDTATIATSSYWYDGARINPANPLPLASAYIGGHSVSVAATDSRGNSATSTVRFLVIGSRNSCIADIVAVLTDIKNKDYPDKPTIAQLLKDCAALLKNLHRDDDRDDH